MENLILEIEETILMWLYLTGLLLKYRIRIDLPVVVYQI
jgi:hypothetical protein